MAKTSETSVKRFVSRLFGFKATEVIPLECSSSDGDIIYVAFSCRGFEYQARLIKGKWSLTVHRKRGGIEWISEIC